MQGDESASHKDNFLNSIWKDMKQSAATLTKWFKNVSEVKAGESNGPSEISSGDRSGAPTNLHEQGQHSSCADPSYDSSTVQQQQ